MRGNGSGLIKRGDLILILVILLAALAAFLVRNFLTQKGTMVRVTVDGKETGVYSLKEDREVLIKGDSFRNVLVIRDGQADMTGADCPDKICVRHKPVSNIGETIVCLPHKVIVTVEAEGEEKTPDVDGISR